MALDSLDSLVLGPTTDTTTPPVTTTPTTTTKSTCDCAGHCLCPYGCTCGCNGSGLVLCHCGESNAVVEIPLETTTSEGTSTPTQQDPFPVDDTIKIVATPDIMDSDDNHQKTDVFELVDKKEDHVVSDEHTTAEPSASTTTTAQATTTDTPIPVTMVDSTNKTPPLTKIKNWWNGVCQRCKNFATK